jgi:hypothetical protein
MQRKKIMPTNKKQATCSNFPGEDPIPTKPAAVNKLFQTLYPLVYKGKNRNSELDKGTVSRDGFGF